MDSNWSIEQTKKLFEYAQQAHQEKKGLMWAFVKMSEISDKSVNSVRNYYYSQLKMFELVPKLADDLGIKLVNSQRTKFDLFDADEIVSLIRTILVNKAEGQSVRATIANLSGNDSKLALRLQNKYRSMITHHKDRVSLIMSDMAKQGLVFYNPYTKQKVSQVDSPDNNYKKLIDYIGSLDEREVDSFFTLLKKIFA